MGPHGDPAWPSAAWLLPGPPLLRSPPSRCSPGTPRTCPRWWHSTGQRRRDRLRRWALKATSEEGPEALAPGLAPPPPRNPAGAARGPGCSQLRPRALVAETPARRVTRCCRPACQPGRVPPANSQGSLRRPRPTLGLGGKRPPARRAPAVTAATGKLPTAFDCTGKGAQPSFRPPGPPETVRTLPSGRPGSQPLP